MRIHWPHTTAAPPTLVHSQLISHNLPAGPLVQGRRRDRTPHHGELPPFQTFKNASKNKTCFTNQTWAHLFDWCDAAYQGNHSQPDLLAQCLQVLAHLQQTEPRQQDSNFL